MAEERGAAAEENKKKRNQGVLRKLASFFSISRILGLIILALLIGLRIQDPSVIESTRLQGFDFMQRTKPREYTPQPVAIVDIDEASLRAQGQWPWPRTKIADLITGIAQRGGIATAFDIVFAEPDRFSPAIIAESSPHFETETRAKLKALPDNETVMANAMKTHRVILGETSVRFARDKDENARELRDVGFATLGEDPKQFLQDFPDLVRNLETLEEFASGFGLFSLEPDADGIYRRIPLVSEVRNTLRLSLAPELLRVATGGQSYAVKSNIAGIEGVVLAGQLVETDNQARVWPYLTPTRGSRFISATSILDGTVDPNRIANHLLLVGTSVIGLEDIRATPVGQMPGVEIHAQVLENVLTKQLLVRPLTSISVELLVTLLAGLLVIILLPRLGAVFSFLSAAMIMAGFVGYSWWEFSTNRVLIDATFPVLTTFALFIFTSTANYIREEQQKGQIRNAFGQYLSPALVDQLSDDPGRLVLGGETRELSVLFSDVRGFTAISESFKEHPQGLTQLMNRFLTVLSQPILDRNGTIDKYMGDAIMAFWNAPLDEPNHARKSCLCALDMINDVNELNQVRKTELPEDEKENFLPINVGVGINTGPCVVGNMGSESRFDYTCLGDTVNLASRLEGQSKPYGLPIVIGAGTAEQIMDELAVFEIDLIRVKGKNEPVKIYSLAGDETFAKQEDFTAFRAMNATMITAYRTQDWQSAFDALELMEVQSEKLGITAEEYIFIYETRIAEFRANPPGPNWDGVYTATSK